MNCKYELKYDFDMFHFNEKMDLLLLNKTCIPKTLLMGRHKDSYQKLLNEVALVCKHYFLHVVFDRFPFYGNVDDYVDFCKLTDRLIAETGVFKRIASIIVADTDMQKIRGEAEDFRFILTYHHIEMINKNEKGERKYANV